MLHEKLNKGITGNWYVVGFAVAVLTLTFIGSSVAQTSNLGTLYVDASSGGTLTAIDANTLTTIHTISIGVTPEGLTCGPDDGVYVTFSGAFGGPRQIVRFSRDLSSSTVVLDFASTPALASSGGPEGPSFGPTKELFFNTRASQGFPHTGIWKLPEPTPPPPPTPPVAAPVQLILPFAGFFGNGEGTAFAPSGRPVARGRFQGFEHNLLAADSPNGRIVRWTFPFTPPQPAVNFITGLSSPNGIAVNNAGNVFVANNSTGLITSFAPNGTSPSVFASLVNPLKIAFDAAGNLYAATFSGPVLRITPSKITTTIANIPGEPNGVAVCPSVALEIKPASISLSRTGKIAVFILSGPSPSAAPNIFDAPNVVDLNALTFGETGNEASLLACDGPFDVNGDGLPDQGCLFDTKLTDLKVGDTMAMLRGRLLNGTWFEATAAVTVIP